MKVELYVLNLHSLYYTLQYPHPHPASGSLPIQKRVVRIPACSSMRPASCSAASVHPYSWGLPFTSKTFMSLNPPAPIVRLQADRQKSALVILCQAEGSQHDKDPEGNAFRAMSHAVRSREMI